MSKVKTKFLNAENASILPSSVEVIDKTVQGVWMTSADAVVVNGSASKAAVYGNTTVKGYAASGSVKSVAATQITDTAATVASTAVVIDDYINATLVAAAKSEVEKGYKPVSSATAETKIGTSTISIIGTAKATDVFAGAVLTDTASTKQYKTNRTASIENATVQAFGGNIKNIYAGGIGANSYTVNSTINLTDTTVSNIYAGGKLGSHITGDVVISITDSQVKNIELAPDGAVLSGNVILNLIDYASIGTISGDGYRDNGTATINFQDYRGTFSGKIEDVDVISISGNSAVTFSKGQDSSLKYAEYVINVSEENAYSQDAFMTFKSDVFLNNLMVVIDGDMIDSGSFTSRLITANTKKFNSTNFDVTNVAVASDDGLIADYMYDLAFETTTDKKGNVSETGNLYFTYTGKGLQVTAEGYKNNVLSSANDDVTFVYSHNSTLDTDANVIAFDFATMGGNDKVTINSDIFYAGDIDLGTGDDTINIHGYLDSLKLGAGTNTVIINGCINADNIEVDDNSENTFVLKGKLAKTTYNISTERNITGLINKTYIYDNKKASYSDSSNAGAVADGNAGNSSSSSAGGSSSSNIVKVQYTKKDAEGNVLEVFEVPYIDSYEKEIEYRDTEDINWFALSTQTAQQFVVENGKNTLIVKDDAGVSDIIMGGEYAKVVLNNAAEFGVNRMIDLSEAAASVLVVDGTINRINFKGSKKDSTVIFDDDTNITLNSIADLDNGNTKIVVSDGAKVTVSDLATASIAALDLTLGRNAVFAGKDFMMLSDNFNGIIGTSVDKPVDKDVYATSLTDAVIYTSGKFVAYDTVSGSLISAKELVLNGATIDAESAFFGTKDIFIVGKTAINGYFLNSIDDDKRIISDFDTVNVAAGSELTIGADATFGKIDEMTVNAAKVNLEKNIQVTTLNLIGEGDFNFNGEQVDVRTVNFGIVEGEKVVETFSGNVDKIFAAIEQTDVDFQAFNSVLKFAKDADLTEHKLCNITYTLTNTILELADGVTVTLEKNYNVADDGDNGTNVSVSATLDSSFGVNGGTIAGNIVVGGVAPISGQPAFASEGTKFTGTVTANEIIAISSVFEDNVTAELEGIMATGTVFNGKTITAANAVVTDSTFAQSIDETIDNLTAITSKFAGDVTVEKLMDTNSEFAGNVTVTNSEDATTYLTGSKVAGNIKAEYITANITDAKLGGDVTADVVVMDNVTMTGSDLDITATNNADEVFGITISNGSVISADLNAQKIAVSDSIVNGNIVTIPELVLALDNAKINGNIGNYEEYPAELVTIEGNSIVSGRVDTKVICAGEGDGTLNADIIRIDKFGGDTSSDFTATINANKVIVLTEGDGIHFIADNKIVLTTKEEIANNVYINDNGNATINASVDAVIDVGDDAVLGGKIVMVEDNIEDIGKHNIYLADNATLNGTVTGNVILTADANIGAVLTGDVKSSETNAPETYKLNLADKAVINGTVSNVKEIFVKEGSATIDTLADNDGILDKLVGNLVVNQTIYDWDNEIVLGRVAQGDDPAYNTAITAGDSVNLFNNDEEVTLIAEKGTQDSITGEVIANALTITAADEHATMTLSDVTATRLTIGENANVTGTASVTNAFFGVTAATAQELPPYGIIADTKIDGTLKFTGSENYATLKNKKAIVGGNTEFTGNLSIVFNNDDDSFFDSNITAVDTTSKTLEVTDVNGNAELGIIDMGKALDTNEYAGEPYIQAGLNVIRVWGNGSNEIKFAGINSEGNLKISVDEGTTVVVTNTITNTKILTLTGDIEANVSANTLNLGVAKKDDDGKIVELIDVDIKGDVASKSVTVNDADITGTLTIETSLYLNGNLAVLNDEGDAAAINGDFSLMTSNKEITGNLTGTITLGDNLYLEGDANGIVAEAASRFVPEITDNNIIVISGNAASVNLGEGTDVFTSATVGSITSGTGGKTVTVKKGSTGTIDLSNANESNVTLGDGEQAVEFGLVKGSKGVDTVIITPVTEFIHDEFYTITGIKTSSFNGFDFSSITENAAYGADEAAVDTLTNEGSISAVVGTVTFVNLTIDGTGFEGDFKGADNAISGTTKVSSVAQDPKSIGTYGPAGTPAATEVGAIYKDILTVETGITGTVDMGKGADIINVNGNQTITKIDFGTSESNAADENYDSLNIASLTTEGIDFSGNLVITGTAITTSKLTSNTIANTVNTASAEYVAAYGNDPSNPVWTSQAYKVMADKTTALGELKFNFSADGKSVESVEFDADKTQFDIINGKTENMNLTIAKELTVTGNVSLANGSTLILKDNLTLTGLATGGEVVTGYVWNGTTSAFEANDKTKEIKYTNVGDLNFSGDGTIEFTAGKTLTANTINAGGSLTFKGASSVEGIDKIKAAEGGVMSFKDNTSIVALDTDLYLDWMDATLETFIIHEDTAIDDISKVLQNTKLYVMDNGVELTFTKTDETTGKFTSAAATNYEVNAELSPDQKNIALTYSTKLQ